MRSARQDFAEHFLFWVGAAGAAVITAVLAATSPLMAVALFAATGMVVAATVFPKQFTMFGVPLLMLVPPTLRLPGAGLPDLTPLRLGVLLVCAGWILHSVIQAQRDRDYPPISSGVLPAAGFYIAYVLLISFSGTASELSRGIGYSVEALLPAWLIWRAARTREDLVAFTDWLIVLVTVAALLAIREKLTHSFLIGVHEPFFFHAPDRGGSLRVQSVFPHPLVLGAAISMILPFAVMRFFSVKRTMRIFPFGAAVIFALALLFTQSRGPWMSAIVGVLVFAGLQRDQRSTLVATLVVGLTVVAFSPMGGGAANSIRGLINPNSGQDAGAFTVQYRQELWTAVSNYAAGHPFGTGPGQSDQVQFIAYVGGSATDLALSIDNAFAKYALEIGPVGLLLFLILLGTVIRSAWLARRTQDPVLRMLSSAVLSAQVGMIVTSFTVATFSWAQLSLLFWLISGAGLAIRSLSLRDDIPDFPSEVVESRRVSSPVG